MEMMRRQWVPSVLVKTITIDDALVLVHQRSGQYFGLNEVGASIWHEIEQGRDALAIIEAILIEYNAERETVVVDTHRLLGELAAAGLID